MRNCIRVVEQLPRVIAAVFCTTLAGASFAQQSGTVPPSELIEYLQEGGLIMYVRHAATNHEEADRNITDLSRCELQRNLSEQGRQESRTLREAVGRFGIPIGEVLSSPYCRAVDTAEIAFGPHEVVHNLRAIFFTDEEETAQINATLRELLSQVPDPEAGNTVIVGHTANLDDVTEVWPRPEGVAHVFRPLGEGEFAHLGRITPSDWSALLAAQ